MLSFPAAIKVYLCTVACDMRRSFDGLSMMAEHIIRCNPFSGHLLVFCNKRSDRVKILYWDGTGLWVMTKRLEQGTFSWPRGVDVENGKLQLSPEALALLLDGVDLRRGSLRPLGGVAIAARYSARQSAQVSQPGRGVP